jgi:hypothetical protein
VRTWRKQAPRVTGAWATDRGNASRTNLLVRESLWGSKNTVEDYVKVLFYERPVLRRSGGEGARTEKIFEKMKKMPIRCLNTESPHMEIIAHGSLYC